MAGIRQPRTVGLRAIHLDGLRYGAHGNTGATNGDDFNELPPSTGHYFWRFLYPSTYHMYPTAAGIQYTTGTGNNKKTLTY